MGGHGTDGLGMAVGGLAQDALVVPDGLGDALQRISETIRDNERVLREATDGHSQAIGSVAAHL